MLLKLELTKEEVSIVIAALDFYSRIWIGQYDEINSLLRLHGYADSGVTIEEYKEAYLRLRSILIPELTGEDFNCSLGIWNSETNSLAKSAYDMQQIIRYTQAWYTHPEGWIGVDFHTPILEGELPQIKCECRENAAGYVMTISGEESNYRLLSECLQVYGCLFEGKIGEIFKHYTDAAEAVQYAKDIEEAYGKIAETGIAKVQPYVIAIEKLKTKIRKNLSNELAQENYMDCMDGIKLPGLNEFSDLHS